MPAKSRERRPTKKSVYPKGRRAKKRLKPAKRPPAKKRKPAPAPAKRAAKKRAKPAAKPAKSAAKKRPTVARVDVGKLEYLRAGMRSLATHEGAYAGATQSEIDAIAAGKRRTQTSRARFEPIKISTYTKRGKRHYVLEDGRHRLAAARRAGARHIAATIDGRRVLLPLPRSRAKSKPAPAKKRKKNDRSAAAKRGWKKRRKRKKLLEQMADLRMEQAEDEQPPGWTERRANLRLIDDTIWRQIVFDYDPALANKKRFEILKELEIDLATKDELDDYLRWVADHYDIDLSDMYRMYLGYPMGSVDAEPDE